MNSLKTGIAKLAEYDIRNHSNLLRWTNTIIWACSLMAEVGTFLFNKKLPDKEKSFIIRQELTAGTISLILMHFVSDRLEAAAKRLVEVAKITPKNVPDHLRTPEMLKKILHDHEDVFIKTLKKNDQQWATKLKGLYKGIGLVAGLAGSIIGTNIFTPIVSNKIASFYQNRALARGDNPLASSTSLNRLSHINRSGHAPEKAKPQSSALNPIYPQTAYPSSAYKQPVFTV